MHMPAFGASKMRFQQSSPTWDAIATICANRHPAGPSRPHIELRANHCCYVIAQQCFVEAAHKGQLKGEAKAIRVPRGRNDKIPPQAFFFHGSLCPAPNDQQTSKVFVEGNPCEMEVGVGIHSKFPEPQPLWTGLLPVLPHSTNATKETASMVEGSIWQFQEGDNENYPKAV